MPSARLIFSRYAERLKVHYGAYVTGLMRKKHSGT